MRKREKNIFLNITEHTLLKQKMPYCMETPEGGRETGEWRRIYNEKLYVLYTSQNVIRVTKTERIRWVGRVAHIGVRKGAYRVLVRRSHGKNTWKI
jgi:hypothetical protein